MTKIVALVSSGRYRQEHYEDVALILRIGATADVKLAVSDVTGTFIRQFADLFAADNPDFNRARFLAACGLES